MKLYAIPGGLSSRDESNYTAPWFGEARRIEAKIGHLCEFLSSTIGVFHVFDVILWISFVFYQFGL
jgi:hypothetical protein